MPRASVQWIMGNARKSRYIALFLVSALCFYLNKHHLFNTELRRLHDLPLPKLRQDAGRFNQTNRGGVPEHARPLYYEIHDPSPEEPQPEDLDLTVVHDIDPVHLPSIDKPAINN